MNGHQLVRKILNGGGDVIAKNLRKILVLFVLGFFPVWGVKGLIGFPERNGDVSGTIALAAYSGDEIVKGLKDVYADYFLIGTAVSERNFPVFASSF